MHYFGNNGDGTFTERTSAAGLDDQLGGLNIMQTDYNNLVSFAGYNPNVGYGANFYEAQHNGNLYQDLVTVNAVPEPSTVMLGSIGFTLVVLWGRFRNHKSA